MHTGHWAARSARRTPAGSGAPHPGELRGIVDLRNPVAHSEAVGRERVEKVRGQVRGIGCEGVLVRLARAKASGR